VTDSRARFEVGDAQALREEAARYDAAVSGLMLNFVPQPAQAVREMQRAVKPDGVVAAYVWDYAGQMQLMRHFWEAAAALDPNAVELDEGRRFPLCQPEALGDLFGSVGLTSIEVAALDIATEFKDFNDYWSPFLGGQGPAPSYLLSLSEERRAALRERIRTGLPHAPDGSIPLTARAWAVRGTRPQ
jgi:SAM-dependent methyltransferase